MTEQPIAPRGRDQDQNPETSSPLPEPDARHAEALQGINVGSDTRAGSLRGGSASGSEIDPDQDAIDAALASEGMKTSGAGHEPRSFRPEGDPGAGQDEVVNTGEPDVDPGEGRADGEAGDDADAATG